MKRGTYISALFVIALIMIDITISVSYAKTKTTIYKVTKVSNGSSLRLRAWPSTKSRIKKSLPFNAKDITETGKSKRVGRAKWIEVRWNENRGWVNKKYLKKTGVLLLDDSNKAKPVAFKKITQKKTKQNIGKSRNKIYYSKSLKKPKRNVSSRNTRSSKNPRRNYKRTDPIDIQIEMPPQEFSGDRYDQTIESGANELRTSFSPNSRNQPLKKN